MRTMLQLLLGLLLTIGVSTGAQATSFSLQFAGPGADCATDGVAAATDCNDGDITDADGDLHFDIGGVVELIVTAYAEVFGEVGEAIQDYPALGGLAVNGPFPGGTDQVDFGQGLLFGLSDGSDFAPTVLFTDNHQAIDPDALIGVVAFADGIAAKVVGATAGEIAGGLFEGETGFDEWLFVNIDKEGPTWYIASMSSTPEPGTAVLLGLGMTGLAARRRKALT